MPVSIPQGLQEVEKMWSIFPDILSTGRFAGYQTRDDVAQLRGAFPIGQNMKVSEAQTFTVRDGWEPVGTETADATPVNRAWVYERGDGTKFVLKAYSTRVDYWIVGVSTAWLLLKGSFTTGLDFGFANIGESGEVTSHSFFCNGTDNWFQFNGARTTVSSATATTIVKTGTNTWTQDGFYTTGTRSVIINGTEYTYTGGEGTATITGVTPDPSAEAVGSHAVQSPRSVSALASFLSQVMMAHDGRIHARQDTRKSVWNYSKLDNPDDFTSGSTDGDGGAKEVEFGGGIISFAKLNKMALALKPRLIKLLDFIQVGSRLDSPRYQTLVSADDKGTTLGATNQKSTFSTPMGLVFVTPDKKMVLLTGVTQNSEPQYLFLSDPISTVFTQGVHDDGAGICVDNVIYYAFKESKDSNENDVMLRGTMLRNTFDAQGKPIPIMWDAPYIGINANDFVAVYDSTSAKRKYEVWWFSSLSSNAYRFIDDKVDNTGAFTTTLRTWAEHFGYPHSEKGIDLAFIEIDMLENSEVTATLLYDIDGFAGQSEYVLKGTDTDNLLQGEVYNPFGASAFGSQKIGSNVQQTELKRYVYYLETKPNIEFFTLSLQISGDKQNNDHNLVRFGYRLHHMRSIPTRRYLKNTS